MKVLFFAYVIFGFVCSYLYSCDQSNKNFTTIYSQNQNNQCTKKTTNDELANFVTFWEKFRKAVIVMDSVELKQLAIFPLTVKGYQDWDPTIKVEKNNFMKYFNKCLNEQTVIDKISGTNLDHIKRLSEIKKSEEFGVNDVNLKWQRVGNMEFEKINSTWKLTQIYTDTRNIN